jgi:hypothetical protein
MNIVSEFDLINSEKQEFELRIKDLRQQLKGTNRNDKKIYAQI